MISTHGHIIQLTPHQAFNVNISQGTDVMFCIDSTLIHCRLWWIVFGLLRGFLRFQISAPSLKYYTDPVESVICN